MHDHCMISMIANQGKHANEQAPSSCVLLFFGSGKPTILVRLNFVGKLFKIITRLMGEYILLTKEFYHFTQLLK